MPCVAAIQMNSSDDVERNLKLTEELVKEAKRQNADLAVLPECFALMARDHEQRLACAEPQSGRGEVQTFLSNLAEQQQVWILGAGIFVQCDDTSKVSNTSWLFDSQGHLISRYDKINLFDLALPNNERYSESTYIKSGLETVSADTPIGKAGLTVCYDLRFPNLYLDLVNEGAIWFAVPSAFAYTTGRVHWEILLRARAIENHAYVVAPAQWGKHAGGRETYGHTMIVDPWGDVVAQKDSGDDVVLSEVDADRVAEIRNRFQKAVD